MNFINSILNSYLSLPMWGRVVIAIVIIAITMIGFVEGLNALGIIEFTNLKEAATEVATEATAS